MLGYPSGSNRVDSVTQGYTPVRSFTHDGAGNVTADDRAGTVYDYRTNKRGRLDQASVGTQVRADYVYDAPERLALPLAPSRARGQRQQALPRPRHRR